jgi:hypothetical protein
MKQKLLDLYRQIPEFKCKESCHDCCVPVPFSKSEWAAVKDKREATGIDCPYATGNGCDIYEQRPFMCRLFGAVDYWVLKCPHGCGPDKFLKEAKARKLTKLYHEMIDE